MVRGRPTSNGFKPSRQELQSGYFVPRRIRRGILRRAPSRSRDPPDDPELRTIGRRAMDEPLLQATPACHASRGRRDWESVRTAADERARAATFGVSRTGKAVHACARALQRR